MDLDPYNQQQPQPQQPLSGLQQTISGGLGQALPYAIPAALGGMLGAMSSGRRSGGSALDIGAGALAGAAMAKGGEAEAQIKQQQMAIEAQKWDLEKQDLQLKLKSGQDVETVAESIKDPTKRAEFRLDPKGYFEDQDWQQYLSHITNDPGYASARGVDPTVIQAMKGLPTKMSQQIYQKWIEERASGKAINGFHRIDNKDGTYDIEMWGPIDPSTGKPTREKIASGTITKMIVGASAEKPTKPPSATAMATLATKWVTDAANTTPGGYLGTTYGAPDEARKASAISAGIAQLTGPPYNMDPKAAEDMVRKAVEPKYMKRSADTGGDKLKKPPPAPKVTGKVAAMPPDAAPITGKPGYFYSPSKHLVYHPTT